MSHVACFVKPAPRDFPCVTQVHLRGGSCLCAAGIRHSEEDERNHRLVRRPRRWHFLSWYVYMNVKCHQPWHPLTQSVSLKMKLTVGVCVCVSICILMIWTELVSQPINIKSFSFSYLSPLPPIKSFIHLMYFWHMMQRNHQFNDKDCEWLWQGAGIFLFFYVVSFLDTL